MAVAALQLSVVDSEDEEDDDDGDDGADNDDDDDGDGYAISSRKDAASYDTRRSKGKGKAKAKANNRSTSGREIDEAFRLFVGGGRGEGNDDREYVITMGALRRVARELKEDVAEGVLRDMILEANGGVGVGKGVRRGEFEAVMRRAGVFR